MKTLIGSASLAAAVTVVIVLVGFGRASSPLAVAVANAATRCPDGFTVTVHGLAAGSQPTSSLSAACVLELGIPAGRRGYGGDGWNRRPSGPVRLHARSNHGEELEVQLQRAPESAARSSAGPGDVPGREDGHRRRRQDHGEELQVQLQDRFAITTSEPTADGHGWVVEASNLNLSKSNINRSRRSRDHAVTVTAICVAMP